MADAAREGDCTFGDLVDRIGSRGFGPLLIFCAAIVMLPTGAIPGVPALAGGAIIVIAVQLLVGSGRPWLPSRLRRLTLSERKLDAAIEKGRPAARFIGAFVSPRAGALASGPVSLRVAALALLMAGLLLIPLGFVPLVPFLMGVPVLVIGMAMTARDGAAMVVGLLLFILPGWMLYRTLAPDIGMWIS
ncbi:exopolysaccharide biosynthesis protein [Rhodobacteraceae bacterium ASV31]|nr:exopolysaccharide biosynthesis protein [Anianabacter salinae]